VFPDRVVIATRNPGKVREILRICADWPVAWVTVRDPTLLAVEETGASYRENALLKARAAAEAVGAAGLADDSGIEVDLLEGGPGLRSARFARVGASDEENLRLMIDRVRASPPAARTARYRCVALLATRAGADMSAEATCEGSLLLEPRGTGGFGYDPIFVPVGETRTMAELSPGEKDLISHRGKAFRALGEALRGT
jgi:XTP/dITP diphosphohydrolase